MLLEYLTFNFRIKKQQNQNIKSRKASPVSLNERVKSPYQIAHFQVNIDLPYSQNNFSVRNMPDERNSLDGCSGIEALAIQGRPNSAFFSRVSVL